MKKLLLSLSAALLFVPSPGRAASLTCWQPDPATGASLAVTVEEVPLTHTAQVLPVGALGKVVAAGDAEKQCEQALANLNKILAPAQSSLSQLAKLNVYLASEKDRPKVQAALARTFSGDTKPAVCFVTGALEREGALVALDAVAVSMANAPAVKAFRREGKRTGGIASASLLPAGPKLYVSGMADTNSLLLATRKTLEKLVAAIGHLGSQREDIVQLRVFLQPMSEVAAVRKEVADFFGGKAPPTVFVDWISANPLVEIELIAAAHGDLSKETNSVSYFTPPDTTDSKVYRRVARVNHGKLIYTSGIYGRKSADRAGQVREIFATLGDTTKQAGSDFEHLVKATYYVTDDAASTALNELRPQFYNPQRPPAASKAKVKSVGLSERTVSLDMIAVTK